VLAKHSKSTVVNKCSVWPILAILITNTDPSITPVSTPFEFHAITNDELIKVVKNLKANKSTGLDNVSTKLVKEAGDSIIPSPNHLFNLSLSTGIFSEDWKVAKVTPIYKSGEKSDHAWTIDLFQ
jgi:hypothetical protein